MTAVTNMWRQLVQRRLWPVAILLIAALAAVPLALAKQPEPEPAPPVAQAVGKSELTETPVVAEAGPSDRAKRRRVLGTAKNPFAVPVVAATSTTTTTSANTDGTSHAAPSTSGSTPVSSGGGTPTPATGGGSPVPTAPVKKPKVYDLYDLTVRFSDSASTEVGPKSTLKRLQPLPTPEIPVLIYMGVLKDGKTAVFLVDSGVEPTGDGDCKPSAGECETIQIRAGETEFFDVKDETGTVTAQYQLDVLKIHQGATTSAKKASASYTGSKAGRRVLKARALGQGPSGYRLNGTTGTIARQSPAAYGAVSHASVGVR